MPRAGVCLVLLTIISTAIGLGVAMSMFYDNYGAETTVSPYSHPWVLIGGGLGLMLGILAGAVVEAILTVARKK